ncbi:hypothetical protein Btru_049926 [Bulinus truncatus]|nr:hypothetical protein Btru_049926 [Bulinus truncatus]
MLSYLYGVLAAIVGDEIIHGFDTQGRFYDKYGNLVDNWTPRVAEEFQSLAECFVNQYNSYEVAPGYAINGWLTLDENIADNGGIKLAFRAYKSSISSSEFTLPGVNLTNDQLFFLGFSSVMCANVYEEYAKVLSFTSTYSENMFRVIGTLSNSREFAEAFNCPVNSTMNPERKCEVW